jgi:PAS domain S-box-containing protein
MATTTEQQVPRQRATPDDLAAALARTELAVAVLDLTTRLVAGVSEPAAGLLGARSAELVGTPIQRLVADEPTGGIPLLATGRLDGFEAPRGLRHTNGTVVSAYVWVHVLGPDRPARLAAAIIAPDHGGPPSHVPEGQDSWVVIGMADENWRVAAISADARRELGCKREHLEGAAVMSVVHPGDLPELLTGLAHVHATGREAAVRVRVRRADGTYLWCRARLAKVDQTSRFLFTLRPLTSRPLPNADRIRDLELRLARIAAEVRQANLTWTPEGAASVADIPGATELTSREWEVLIGLAKGHRVPRIAADLNLTDGTVRNHLSKVFRKLGVSSQSELLALLATQRSRGTLTSDG